MAGKPGIRLSAQPILKAIEACGGIAHLPGLPGMKVYNEDKRCHEFIITPEERLERKRAEGMIRKGKMNGYFTLDAADKICCDYIGVHPVEMYGEAYWGINKYENEMEEAA